MRGSSRLSKVCVVVTVGLWGAPLEEERTVGDAEAIEPEGIMILKRVSSSVLGSDCLFLFSSSVGQVTMMMGKMGVSMGWFDDGLAQSGAGCGVFIQSCTAGRSLAKIW